MASVERFVEYHNVVSKYLTRHFKKINPFLFLTINLQSLTNNFCQKLYKEFYNLQYVITDDDDDYDMQKKTMRI